MTDPRVVSRTLPRALAELHRSLPSDVPVVLSFRSSEGGRIGADAVAWEWVPGPQAGPGAGTGHPTWNRADLSRVLEGAGFVVDRVEGRPAGPRAADMEVRVRRRHTLPDTVGPAMRLLVCGLNPSRHAADAGIGFVTPGNRFWPAAIGADLVSRDRDPFHALDVHGVGMTDLAKRATRRADELDPEEYREGWERLEWLVDWLTPAAVCFVGLAGYRAVVDRRARAGRQPDTLAGRPVYLMPSTSGLNTHSRLEDLIEHLRRASALA